MPIGRQMAERLVYHQGCGARRGRRRSTSCGRSASPIRRAAMPIPHRAQRRHAPARADRHGLRLQSEACSSPMSRPRPSTSRCRPRSWSCCASARGSAAPRCCSSPMTSRVVAQLCDRVVCHVCRADRRAGRHGRGAAPSAPSLYQRAARCACPPTQRAARSCAPSAASRQIWRTRRRAAASIPAAPTRSRSAVNGIAAARSRPSRAMLAACLRLGEMWARGRCVDR